MSAGAQGGTRSVARLRRMLANNLLERAVASSEMRWPGSGPMVRLVHEWGELPAAARRQRMAEIGPEELAKFRFLGEMNPELGKVLDDLEARGIIPPAVTEPPPPLQEDDDGELVAAAPAPSAPSAPSAPQPPSFEEAVIDAAVDYAAAGAAAGAGGATAAAAMTARERMAALQAEAGARSAARSRDATDSSTARLAASAAAAAAAAAVSAALPNMQSGAGGDPAVAEALKQRPAAHINLHKENQERMQVALEQASSILDRVRSTVDRQAQLPMTASWPTTERPQTQPAAPLLSTQPTPFQPTAAREREPQRAFEMTEPKGARDAWDAAAPGASDLVLDPAVMSRRRATTRNAQQWTAQLREAGAVVVVDDQADVPTMAVMQQVGQALRLPVVELDSARQTRHELWGGLRREGRTTAAFAGALPLALAQGSLVVLRGSLPRAHQARIAEGYIDIPGTRASMRVHPDSRVLLLG